MAKPRVTLTRGYKREEPYQLGDWKKAGHIKGIKIEGDVIKLPKGEYQVRSGGQKMMIWKVD